MGSFFDTIGPFLPGPLEIIGFYGQIFLPILVLFFIARMIFPGRAPIGFRRDLIGGVIRTIHITPHIPGVDSTVRYMSVATIEATTPNGVVKYKDTPPVPVPSPARFVGRFSSAPYASTRIGSTSATRSKPARSAARSRVAATTSPCRSRSA